jgi:hypothetical protein
MLIGFIRLIVMNFAVVAVMMADIKRMFHFVGEVHHLRTHSAALHGKALQRQYHKHEQADKTAQNNLLFLIPHYNN